MSSINADYEIKDFGEGKAIYSIGGKDKKFVPNLNMSFNCRSFDESEQYFINLNRKDVKVEEEKPEFENGELKLKVGLETDIWKIVDNKLKWNIQFDAKPESNEIDWKLDCSPELSFYYQHDLEYQFNNYGGEGYKTLAEFLDNTYQPENTVGSYAVYCNKQGHIKFTDKRTKVDYSTGKLTHILRPLCIDDEKKTAWAELLIDLKKNLLRIIIPKGFLDSCKYPLILDPVIFGHDSQGALQISISGTFRGVEGTSSGAGTGDTIGGYFTDWNSGEKIKGALYVSSSGNLLANGTTDESSAGGSGRQTFSFTTSPTIAASTDYLPVVWGDSYTILYYDSAACNRVWRTYTYNGWPDPHGGTYGSSTYKYSTFCEYTESAAAASPTAILDGPLVGPLGGPV